MQDASRTNLDAGSPAVSLLSESVSRARMTLACARDVRFRSLRLLPKLGCLNSSMLLTVRDNTSGQSSLREVGRLYSCAGRAHSTRMCDGVTRHSQLRLLASVLPCVLHHHTRNSVLKVGLMLSTCALRLQASIDRSVHGGPRYPIDADNCLTPMKISKP